MFFRFGRMYFCPNLRVRRRRRDHGGYGYGLLLLFAAMIFLCCAPYWCLYLISVAAVILLLALCLGRGRR